MTHYENQDPPTHTHQNETTQEEEDIEVLLEKASGSGYREAPSISPWSPEVNNIVRPLVDQMREALDYKPQSDMEATLNAQARVLDRAFRRLIGNADKIYSYDGRCEADLIQYAVAFKAQERFCRTFRALELLKQREKANEKDKLNERNEGINIK